MNISFLGKNCFKIENKGLVLITNPDCKLFRGKSDITVYTEYPASLLHKENLSRNEPFEVKMPGQYEVKGVELKGTFNPESNDEIVKTYYLLNWAGISLGILGDSKKEIPLEVREDFTEIDVLLIQNSEKALEKAKKLNPKLIILGVEKNNLKSKNIDVQEKFSFSKKDLQGKTRIIGLKGKN